MDPQAVSAALVAGLAAGLASIPHCAAMCGPLSAVACGGGTAGAPGSARRLRYQLGRLSGYALVGTIAGRLGAVFTDVLRERSGWLMPVLTGVALASIAYRLWAPVWGSRTVAAAPLTQLGRPGRFERLVRAGMRLLPREPGALGALSALLPCGALYAALLLATGTANGTAGAALMLGFAVSSAPALLLADIALRARLLRPGLPTARLVSVGLLVAAVFFVARPVHTALFAPHDDAPHAGPSCH